MDITTARYISFHRTITEFYYQSGRHDMAWRQPERDGSFDPYKILVSELMLQQTQVARVEPKYQAFLERFPTVKELAKAPLGDVLKSWSGLGYNRRARYLWEAAGSVVHDHKGVFPKTVEDLRALPGIGPNTAGAIMAYAYSQPVVFLETNVRTVIIHHFFSDQTGVADKDIAAVLRQLLPGRENGSATLTNRQFYWALMDYGTYLKKTVGNKSRFSKSYTRQSPFRGSRRQLRGAVIRKLTEGPRDALELGNELADDRTAAVIKSLMADGLVRQEGKVLRLG